MLISQLDREAPLSSTKRRCDLHGRCGSWCHSALRSAGLPLLHSVPAGESLRESWWQLLLFSSYSHRKAILRSQQLIYRSDARPSNESMSAQSPDFAATTHSNSAGRNCTVWHIYIYVAGLNQWRAFRSKMNETGHPTG